MAGRARRKLLGGCRKGVFHCSSRCVRGMFLCGRDRTTGRDYAYRRDWIVRREEQLAGLFAIDLEFRAELSSHLHLVLRTMPEVARRWSPREVARRWLTATKLAKSFSDAWPEVEEQRIEALICDKPRIEQLRRRLCNVSWFMGVLSTRESLNGRFCVSGKRNKKGKGCSHCSGRGDSIKSTDFGDR